MIGLYHNEGNGLYVDEAPSSTVGRASLLTLAFGIFFFDYDLDGRLDIFAGNGHVADDIAAVQPRVTHAQLPHVFRNLGERRFEAVTRSARPRAETADRGTRGRQRRPRQRRRPRRARLDQRWPGPALPKRRRQPQPLPQGEDDRHEVEPGRDRGAGHAHARERREAVAVRPHRLLLLLPERHRAHASGSGGRSGSSRSRSSGRAARWTGPVPWSRTRWRSSRRAAGSSRRSRCRRRDKP